MTVPEGVMLPNEIERRQIFYTLKRWSSYTAWKRILDFYQAWADVAEKSLRQASVQGLEEKTSIHQSHYVLILKGLADMDEAVSRLKKGDKRIFKYASYAELVHAYRPLGHETERLWRVADGDIGINYETTPLWDEYARAVDQLAEAWGECSPPICESHHDGTLTHAAPLPYGVWLQEQLPQMVFPDPPPDVPNPTDAVLIGTGHGVPCSGIWEPVDVPAPRILSLFKSPPPKGPFRVIGCMNYLHGGASAPKVALETEEDNPNVKGTWRLLWKDDRYEDGKIPEEEKHYVFLQPQVAKEEASVAVSGGTTSMTVAESGQRAPTAGRWLVEDDLHASVELKLGDELPLHGGRKVRWVLAST